MKKTKLLLLAICATLTLTSNVWAKEKNVKSPAVVTTAATAATPIPVVDLDYKILSDVLPPADAQKIEVIEFFWYGCPHCYHLEPSVEMWMKEQQKDVVVRRVPVAFNEKLLLNSQLYYTLEQMVEKMKGTPTEKQEKLRQLHLKVFEAFHKEKQPLMTEKEIFKWAAKQGLAQKEFESMFRSFGIQAKAKAAQATFEKARLDGVPALVVQGKYVTSPAITAGSQERTIVVLKWLVEQVRNKKM